MFKLQDPQDLVTKMYILEYMREISADTMYQRATEDQKRNFFYKFENDESTVAVDFNWEYCIFEATMIEMEYFIELFLPEIEEIETKRKAFLTMMAQKRHEEEMKMPVDINLMDVAKAAINDSRGKIIGA